MNTKLEDKLEVLSLPITGTRYQFGNKICEVIDIQISEHEDVYPIIKISLAKRGIISK